MYSGDYYNDKGYPDPVAYQAMKNWEKEERQAGRNPGYRPLVFICSPYSGNVEKNVANAQFYCHEAVEKGYLPIAPHLFFPQFLNDSISEERELGINLGKILLTKCREVWVFGEEIENVCGFRGISNSDIPVLLSSGMEEEITLAKRKGIPVRFFNKSGMPVTSSKTVPTITSKKEVKL